MLSLGYAVATKDETIAEVHAISNVTVVNTILCPLQPPKPAEPITRTNIPSRPPRVRLSIYKTRSPKPTHSPHFHLLALAHNRRHQLVHLAGGNVGAPRRRAAPRPPRRVGGRLRRAFVPALAGAVPFQLLVPVQRLLPALPSRPLGGALRRRGRGVRRGGRAGLAGPRPVLPRARGLALRGPRAHGPVRAPGARALVALRRGRARARRRRAHGALRQPAVRGRAGRRAGEARCGAAGAQQDVRHRALLLRHPAPPDRFAPLPRRVRRRRGGQERHAHRRRQGPGEELPQRLLRRLLPLRPVPAKAEGECEPGGLRRRPGAADAGAGLPADGADVAAGQEQDDLHPHRLRGAPRHALHRPPDGVRQRRGAAVQPGPGEHAAGRGLAAVRAHRQHELGGRRPNAAAGLPPWVRALPDDSQQGRVLVNSERAMAPLLLIQMFL